MINEKRDWFFFLISVYSNDDSSKEKQLYSIWFKTILKVLIKWYKELLLQKTIILPR
jgi:hypothetical protein